MTELHSLLSCLPIFQNFNEVEINETMDKAVCRNIEKGEYLAHYGEVWPYMLVIDTGVVNVVKLSSEGRNLGAVSLVSGEIFLTPSFFDEGPLPASLEVKESGRVYLWHRDAILPLFQKNCDVLWAICLLLARRIRQASEYVEELAFQPVHGRLARLLLEKFGEAEDTQVAREFTLDEMGTMIGTTPVMVCKMLSRFATEGLVKVSRTQFELLDKVELEKMAGKK